MKYLGIDYGSKRVGTALSDEGGHMGFPHLILANTSKLRDDVCALIAEKDVGGVVIGDSRTFAGTANPIAHEAKELGEHITARCGIPVFYESEVLTSAEARRAPAKEAKTRSPKKKSEVDASAAALILTSFLSKHDHA